MWQSIRFALVLTAAGAILAGACSDPAPTPTAAPTQVPLPTVTPAPTPAPLPPTVTPEPTEEPEPTATPQLDALFSYSRAVRLLRIREFKDAIAAFGLVIRRLPDFAEAYHGRGLAYYGDGHTNFAFEDFDKAIELKPELAEAYKDRAVLYHDEGDTGKAIVDLKKALILYHPVRDARKLAEAMMLLDQFTR